LQQIAMIRFILLLLLISIACTKSENELIMKDGRIVGGYEVSIQKHQHQVALRYKSCAQCVYSHSCGGSLIAADIVISAAHCTFRRYVSQFIVVAGSDNHNGGDGYINKVRKIIMHDSYNPATLDHDVSILFLATEFPIGNGFINTIDMAYMYPKDNDKAIITGWGRTTQGGQPSPKLMEVEIPIVSQEKCRQAYGQSRITNSMICAGLDEGGKDSCQGDSGGPLLVNGQLTGIVSWGIGCAEPEYPGVYASVPFLRQWIEKAIYFEYAEKKMVFL